MTHQGATRDAAGVERTFPSECYGEPDGYIFIWRQEGHLVCKNLLQLFPQRFAFGDLTHRAVTPGEKAVKTFSAFMLSSTDIIVIIIVIILIFKVV